MPVNVRQADWEKDTSRLDENSRWPAALVELAIGGLLLLAAGVASNRIVLFRRRWLTAPAVVTAVEPVHYGDDVRWRIRFAYFDRHGVPQESADQVVPGRWKTGDRASRCISRKSRTSPRCSPPRTSRSRGVPGLANLLQSYRRCPFVPV